MIVDVESYCSQWLSLGLFDHHPKTCLGKCRAHGSTERGKTKQFKWIMEVQ